MDRYRVFVFAAGLIAFATIATADPRPFTFSNDTYPMGKGDWEFEQWVTWRHHKDEDSGFNRVDFREEFEFGIADNFDLAFYLPSWRYEDSKEHDNLTFQSVDVEGIVYLSNPVTDFVGLGLYGEGKIGDDFLGFEAKLLVQKDIGNWIFLYNLVAETEVEGILSDAEEENEVEGELKHTFGVSYALTDGIFVGGEAIVESVYEDWSHYEGTHVYAGPVISFQNLGNFWVTITPTFLLTQNDEDEADVQLRLIAGYQF
jgi:hypothetical protein